MTLKDKITTAMTAAMKAKDADRLSVLRMTKSALMNEATKKSATYELSDDESLKVLNSLVKQRRDSVEQFEKAGRDEMAAKERAEIKVLEEYLPQAATAEEIERAVSEAISETGATSIKEMGAVMKAAQTKLAGKSADGKLVSETVKTKLQNL
ncbi:MAG: GatB/YqeY domain-containing protein [Acidobacteriota bacterium]|nr:GatB/YqeY domain-containing protein [Acidobacteriota bacterium]